MKTNIKTLVTLIALFCSITSFAQDAKNKAIELIKEGIALNDKGKYTEAIEKYDEAIKTDPDNLNGPYEKALTLVSIGKGTDAIPILEKVAATNTMPAAYDLLGGIYDDKGEFDKALNYYKQGIKLFPQYAQLKLNLSLAYMRQKNFTDAERLAIEAIKLRPKYASGSRAYAMATWVGDNQAASLLAWCSFLLYEPSTKRSVEGLAFLKRILNSGIQKKADGSVSMTIPSNSPDMAKKLAIQIAVTGSVVDKKGLTAVDSLALQLESVFKIFAEQSVKEPASFHKKFMVDYFGALASSGNTPAFTRYITMTTNAAENNAWAKAHPTEVKAFIEWATSTKREFE